MRFPKPIVGRSLRSCVLSVTCAVLVIATSWAAEKKTPAQVLFTNVNIFDGKSDKLAMGMSVLIEGNLIKQISRGGIKTNRLATELTPQSPGQQGNLSKLASNIRRPAIGS